MRVLIRCDLSGVRLAICSSNVPRTAFIYLRLVERKMYPGAGNKGGIQLGARRGRCTRALPTGPGGGSPPYDMPAATWSWTHLLQAGFCWWVRLLAGSFCGSRWSSSHTMQRSRAARTNYLYTPENLSLAFFWLSRAILPCSLQYFLS